MKRRRDMSVDEVLRGLWKSESKSVVHGWVGEATTPKDTDVYVKVTCVAFGLKFVKDRMKGRAPVFVSEVDWPNGAENIQITKTLGPSSFEGIHDGGFGTTIFSSVDLTDALPLNQGSIDIRAVLLSLPQTGLLDRATAFLSDLADLTQVPQLTAAAPIASKIASGVDKLLGNDEANGLIALMTSVSLDEPKAGYYVVTSLKADDGWTLRHLNVEKDQLRFWAGAGEWKPIEGVDFLLLRVSLLDSQPKRWRAIEPITTLWQRAKAALTAAKTPTEVKEAGRLALAAMDRAAADPNLTVKDRKKAAADIHRDWKKALEQRVQLLTPSEPKDDGRHADDAAAPVELEPVINLKEFVRVGKQMNSKMVHLVDAL